MSHLERIQSVFQEVFDNPDLTITATSTPAHIEDWDSVAMVQIVLGIEAEFNIRMTTDEVAEVKSVADLLRAVERHAA